MNYKTNILAIILVIIGLRVHAQDENILIGINSPAYGIKIKTNFQNTGWARSFTIANENATEDFIQFGANGHSDSNGISSFRYGYIGRKYNDTFMVFRPNGNVGIGTTTPSEKLQIAEGNLNIFGYHTSRYIRFTETKGNYNGAFINYDGTNNVLNIGVNNVISNDPSNDYNAISIVRSTGNVGIGNSNPSRALVINGSAADNLVLKRNGGTDANNTIKFENENVNMYAGASTSNDFAIGFHPNLNSNAKFIISSNTGNVGIGTTNPGIWKLAVNGEIRAKEIKVETGWSDFVFENTYQLPSLKEVENHIQQKGHLKDIPSAKEVEENGIFLGEMDAKLLQKIEELTLYTIQQQKEIEILKAENKEIKQLNKKLIELQNKLDKLIQVK
ncbi:MULTISPECIES: hypothetical protein [Mesonia]|uniref:Uncharacterized protein n=1 Tax=Mesonia oceanica TaxID=2687242 RepID=A0AC61YAD1_9FLAO|nr:MULTISPECIES: hypothetical protein [Mesonia]MAN29342.1 hypothetical protein [Mesonia sp.]MAQ41627.1 hypothetical protein [Mesonia sp.]VVV01466.1 hypothetical protein FVB9532_02758 [Mesonia oceanica]